MECFVAKLALQTNYCSPRCSSLYNQHRCSSFVTLSRRSRPSDSLTTSLSVYSSSLSSNYKAFSWAVASSPEAYYDEMIASPPVGVTDSPKTIRVKFILPKNCLFGQHFHIVGDHPILGLWDPKNAIPLEWSQGHIWTAEMNLPVGETVKFKFILRGPSGQVEWQPGPDRMLEIRDTDKTIVVTEEWDNVKKQKIIEEDEAVLWTEEPNDDETVLSHDKKLSDTLVSADTGALEKEKNPTDDGGEALLVPGLTLNSELESEADVRDVASSDVTFGPDSAEVQLLEKEENSEASTENQVEEVTVNLSRIKGDYSEQAAAPVEVPERNESKDGSSKTASGILENDFQWGRKAVVNILYSLGFNV